MDSKAPTDSDDGDLGNNSSRQTEGRTPLPTGRRRASVTPEELAVSPDEAFEMLYADHPLTVSRQASRAERRDKQYVALSFVYGEIAFAPFRSVLDKLKRWHHILPKPGGVFLDIGSGSGKAVFAAALLHDFDACFGIEVLEQLVGISTAVLHKWEKQLRPSLPMQKRRTRITFTLGDAATCDWPAQAAAADLVFINSTCFSERLRRDLATRLAVVLKPGAVVITATHALPTSVSSSFEMLRQLIVPQEAWGNATWFMHRKK